MYRVSRTYTFEAAHSLPLVADDHKCKRLHGHSYRVLVTLQADALVDGMVLDYDVLDGIVQPLIDRLDHRNINDEIENSTAENAARWFGERIIDRLEWLADRVVLHSVEVKETARANAIWFP
jgi:6-pyruvoyltetrahydropterin/6-carboxytetrahydropterin synthase